MSSQAAMPPSRNAEFRRVLDEESDLLGLMPANNGHAVLADKLHQWVDQFNASFVERVEKFFADAEAVGVDTTDVRARYVTNWQYVVNSITADLRTQEALFVHAPIEERTRLADQLVFHVERLRRQGLEGGPPAGGPQ